MGRRAAAFEGDVHVAGIITAQGLIPPSGSVTNNSVVADAQVATSKLVHRHVHIRDQAPGSAIVAATYEFHGNRAAGTIVALEAAVTGAIATGADRTVTIDLKKSTGEAAFVTVLTSTIVLNNVSVLRRLVAAVINTTGLVDGDLLQVTVAVAGSAANQALGLLIVLTLDENAQ